MTPDGYFGPRDCNAWIKQMAFLYSAVYSDRIYSDYESSTKTYYRDTKQEMYIQVLIIVFSGFSVTLFLHKTKKLRQPFGFCHFLLASWLVIQIPSAITLSLLPSSQSETFTKNY